LTRTEALSLTQFVDAVASKAKPWYSIDIDHEIITLLTVVRGTRLQASTFDRLTLRGTTSLGSNVQVAVDTNVRDAETLRRVIAHAGMQATPPPPPAEIDPDDIGLALLRARTYLPVTLWHETTAAALNAPPTDIIARILPLLQHGAFIGSATCAAVGHATLRYFSEDVHSWGEETDSELAVTVYAADGKTTGWSGQACRDITQLDSVRVVHEAIDMAQRNRGGSRVEPGRYTAILSSTAVGQLLAQSGPLFNRDSLGPFHIFDKTADGHQYRLGQKVFDARLTLTSDPTDPEFGDFPFFHDCIPTGKAAWVKDGVLTTMSVAPISALRAGLTPLKDPPAIKMFGGTTSLEQMIASCERGLYVHRFSGVNLTDQQSGSMTGNTRDGCWFIKNGKIVTPTTNFRIYQSPFASFNKVLALGPASRVAFGFTSTTRGGDPLERWLLPPVSAPLMMVEDFNFSALSDAV